MLKPMVFLVLFTLGKLLILCKQQSKYQAEVVLIKINGVITGSLVACNRDGSSSTHPHFWKETRLQATRLRLE